MQVEVVRLEGRTPLIFIDIPAANGGSDDDCVLLYGHLDKQPEMTGWDDDLGPWKPVIKGDRLYGRGGADDGYAIFGSLTAIMALQEQGVPHARCVVLIEACEESGSYDLPAYVDHLAERIGKPSLVVCLDSGCGNYEQLWCTTSLRGLAGGNFTVKVLERRRALRRRLGHRAVELPPAAPAAVAPRGRERPAASSSKACTSRCRPSAWRRRRKPRACSDTAVFDKFPLLPGMKPMADDLTELVLNRTWRPALSVTGVDGMPPLSSAGNVLRPYTSVKLSLRLPPTLDGKKAGELLKQTLMRDPPNGAQGHARTGEGSAPAGTRRRMSPWLAKAIDAASQRVLRPAGDVHGRRRHDSVHGHARREVPRRAVHDHRRARPAFQCARPERVPAHPDGQARHRLRRRA